MQTQSNDKDFILKHFIYEIYLFLILELSHVCGVAAIEVHSQILNVGILEKIGKNREARNSYLLSVESMNGSQHLLFWSLGTLTSLRDWVQRLVA
jgi:hypothetical protein